MTLNVLILGASYGGLLATKLIMAGHNVTMVCRATTADLINAQGIEVRIKLRGEARHRPIRSDAQLGELDAADPASVDPADYDMVALAMAEPHYAAPDIRALMGRIAAARRPCLSIMNMPPLPYLQRIAGLDTAALTSAYACPEVWAGFDPDLMTLCSPDPQAYRVAEEGANVLHVGLPTNFKAAVFAGAAETRMLTRIAEDIEAVRLDGQEVPVKLRVHESLFVPLAKWSMLLTGNYRCVTDDGMRPIREAVETDPEAARDIYAHVDALARNLGANPADQVPFEKYAKAATGLLKPSSVARSVEAGAASVERVDRLVKLIGDQRGMGHAGVDRVVATVEARIAGNRSLAA